MYFHPLIPYLQHGERLLAACRDFSELCLDGVNRQNSLCADAIVSYCGAQRENLHALSSVADPGQFFECCAALAEPAPMQAVQVSIRSGEIAADLRRRAMDVLRRHTEQLGA